MKLLLLNRMKNESILISKVNQ